MKKSVSVLAVIMAFVVGLWAKDAAIVLQWPQDKPAIKLAFGKFQQVGSLAGQSTYVCDVVVENLTDRLVPRASFTVYGNDRNNVRIGDGLLLVSDLGPQQRVKARLQFTSVGIPASLTLSAKKDMLAVPGAKTIPLKVLSVSPGAQLKVDGFDVGSTPVMVKLTVGSHNLELAKEGYAPGITPPLKLLLTNFPAAASRSNLVVCRGTRSNCETERFFSVMYFQCRSLRS